MNVRRRRDPADFPGGKLPPPERLGRVLSRYLDTSGLGKRMAMTAVLDDWAGLVGSKIAAETIPLRISADGTLFVAVSTPAWMMELSLLEPQILVALNASPDRPPVKKIRWQARPVRG